jgi:hypothetical protein
MQQEKEDDRLSRERLEQELMRIEEQERRRNEGKHEQPDHQRSDQDKEQDDDVAKIANRALGDEIDRHVKVDRVETPHEAELLYTTNDAHRDANKTAQAALNSADRNLGTSHTPTIAERVVETVDDEHNTATRRAVGFV